MVSSVAGRRASAGTKSATMAPPHIVDRVLATNIATHWLGV
jgi:hypothetical protein